MEVLIISSNDISKFPLLNKEKDSYWVPMNNTVGGEYWLTLETESDIKKAKIPYTLGEVIITKTEALPNPE